MYSSAIVAVERGKYKLCTSILSLLVSEHMNNLSSFISIERGQHFITRLVGHMYLAHLSKPLTLDVLDALTLFIHRLVYHLHKTYENDVNEIRMYSARDWKILAQEIHFVAIWIIKKVLLPHYELSRIYEICHTIITPLLPTKRDIGSESGYGGNNNGTTGGPGSSNSPTGFVPNTPDEIVGGNTPHPTSSSSNSSSSSSTTASFSMSSVDKKAAGFRQWWASKEFGYVRKAYTALAQKAHIEKGGNEKDTIGEHMQKLLKAMHVNTRDGGMGSSSASPGFPSSVQQFGSPLASPANMTPMYGNVMSVPMPSASPLVSSERSSPGSGSDGPNATPSPLEHSAPSISDNGQPPIKRARLE